MNKNDCKIVTDELRKGIVYEGIDIEPLCGCGLSEFPQKKMVRKEVIVMHLRWQCVNLDGTIDDNQLTEELETLKFKKVIMI